MDAAEAVEVAYEELPFVLHSEDAMRPGAPAVWDEVPDNVLVDTPFGDAEATDRAFARAAHVVKRKFHVGRVTGVPMEPRAALGAYDAASGRYTLYAGSGGAVRQKNELAAVLGIAPERCTCSRTTSAAISARATASSSSSAWCCGPRKSSAVR